MSVRSQENKLSALGSGFVLQGRQEYYAPTGVKSQAASEAGETRTRLSIAKSIGKLDLKYNEELRYYLQQYETNSLLKSGVPDPNANYRLLSLLDIGYNFTKDFSIGIEGGFVNEAMYPDSFNNTP